MNETYRAVPRVFTCSELSQALSAIIPLGLIANRSLKFNVPLRLGVNPPHRDAKLPAKKNTASHSLNRGGAKTTYGFLHLSFDCMSSRRRASKDGPWLVK
jgi:hypothetical protein